MGMANTGTDRMWSAMARWVVCRARVRGEVNTTCQHTYTTHTYTTHTYTTHTYTTHTYTTHTYTAHTFTLHSEQVGPNAHAKLMQPDGAAANTGLHGTTGCAHPSVPQA